MLTATALTAASLVLTLTPALGVTSPPTPGATSTLSPSGQPVQVVTIRDKRITESSGLAASPTRPDLVWTVNDSGGSATVYGVSLRTGRVTAVLRLADTQARDWEAMAAGPAADGTGLLWIGDVGDNRGVRESVVLRLVPEPTRLGATTSEPVSLRVRYPGGPVDVETLIWTPDRRLLLVSKGLLGAVVYEVPQTAVTAALAGRSTSTPALATRLATASQSLVTDGVALPDGRIVLRGYQGAAVYAGPSGGRLTRLQSVPLPAQEQGETVAVLDGGAALLVGSEGAGQPLWRVPFAAPAEATSTPTPTPTLTPIPTPTAAAPSTNPPGSPAAPQPTPPPRALLVVFFIGGIASLATILTRYQRQRRRRRR